MPRRVSDRAALSAEIAAAQIDDMVAGRRARRSSSSTSKRAIERELAEVERRVAEDDWEGIRPGQLVAVYAWCHIRAYGVRPEELMSGKKWSEARRMAGLMVKRKFDGDVAAALEFMRWAWGREGSRVERSRTNGRPVRRISWYDQFVGGWLLTDYLVDRARETP